MWDPNRLIKYVKDRASVTYLSRDTKCMMISREKVKIKFGIH